MRFVIVAGGTGGHIYPGIAIAEALRAKDPQNQVLFIGGREGPEKEIVSREGFRIELIPARALIRKISYKALSSPFVTVLGFFKALALLKDYRPDLLIVTGGYVSFPVIAAALVRRIPFFLHEQNALPGFTNRLWHRFAKQVALSFEESLKYMSGTVVGNPVREKILSERRVRSDRRTVLIMGGSQGAFSINKNLVAQIEGLKDFDVYHIIGKRDFDRIRGGFDAFSLPFYHPIEYMYNIEKLYARADLVVSRAGATAISEILAVGLPSILIPFPYSAEGHQDLNAKVVADAGAALVMKDQELAGLSDRIRSVLNDCKKLGAMAEAAGKISKSDAARRIVELIYAEH